MIGIILGIFSLILVVYFVIYLLQVPANKWTELLHSIVDPALNVTRQLMGKYLPGLTGKGMDWSPVVLFVALIVVGWICGLLSNLPLIGWLF